MFRKSTEMMSLILAITLASYHTPAFGHGSSAIPLSGPPLRNQIAGDVIPIESPIPFVNFETSQVHPLDLDGDTLVAVNTADNRLEVFDVSSGVPVQTNSIPVGYDPVSARFEDGDSNLVWVVNHISDSISIVNLSAGVVEQTLQTGDEPCDVVFATSPGMNSGNPVAVISCSSNDILQLWDQATYTNLDLDVEVTGEDPRALATNSTGSKVYAAVFESGNHSSIILGAELLTIMNVDPSNPYNPNTNPPYNDGIPGTEWVTPHGSSDAATMGNLPGSPLPDAALILKNPGNGTWLDDNGADWAKWISGVSSSLTDRPTGWDVLDNDVAILDATSGFDTANQTFSTGLMNLVMAIAVSPDGSKVVTVGTDATNEVRFEPVINGTFVRVFAAITNSTGGAATIVDMNEEHLDAAQIAQDGGGATAYHDHTVPQADRNKSIGDPRGVVFNSAGTRIFVTGMGSNNVVILDATTGERAVTAKKIEVGEGPTGIVYHSGNDRVYVLNKFAGSISTINASTLDAEFVIGGSEVSFYDPTPLKITQGRPHLYSTHDNSGLGQLACGSCHIDARMDRLSWDLGNPVGGVKLVTMVDLVTPLVDQHNLFDPFNSGMSAFDDFHPMKGPMTTQTLQDIIGKEPLHWRGDKSGVEQFSGAFDGLQGDDAPLNSIKMQQFEDFLSTLHFGPNPHRAPDNSFAGGPDTEGGTNSTLIPLTRHYSDGRFTPEGTQLPDGDAWAGFNMYVNVGLDGSATCVECHTLPMGSGATEFTSDNVFGGPLSYTPIPKGPLGESHLAMVHQDGTGQKHFKTPHIRNQFDKEGFTRAKTTSRAGFGVLHDGGLEGMTKFLSSGVFGFNNINELANVIAFCLSINGGFDEVLPLMDQLSSPRTNGVLPSPPGGETQSAHASVGKQRTIMDQSPPTESTDWITWAIGRANVGHFGIVVHGIKDSAHRSWAYASGTGGSAVFQSDRKSETATHTELLALAGSGTEITYTVVPTGLDGRLGLDRDFDGGHDGNEAEYNTDPANPEDHKWVKKNYVGTSFGTELMPHTSFDNAAADLTKTPGKSQALHLQAGTYDVATTLNTKMWIVAENGKVTLN